jgi:hypothetical protein
MLCIENFMRKNYQKENKPFEGGSNLWQKRLNMDKMQELLYSKE